MSISLKELKKNRLTPPEKYVLDFIDGAKPTISPNGNIHWWKDGVRLFIQDFRCGELWVSYTYIWSVLIYDFGLSINEVQELLTNILYDYTDNGKLKILTF